MQIFVPRVEMSPFSLYAQGLFISKEIFDEGFLFTFEQETKIILYYSYPTHRRAYIISKWDPLLGLQKAQLPNVHFTCNLLYTAVGRNFDNLKNAAYHLDKITYTTFYRYSVQFFFDISQLVQSRKATLFNLGLLVEKMENRNVRCIS